MSKCRRNRKKTLVCVSKSKKSKKQKRKPSNKEQGSKQCNNGRSSDKNNRTQNKITVQQARIPCRRYEEFHDHFLTYDKIILFLSKIINNNPGGIEVVAIGNSGQGKPIYMALITAECSSNDPKHATFIVAGLKGDDSIAVSNALYMIDYLCKNPSYIKIMDYFIVPCANPDAYDAFIKSNTKEENKRGTKRSRSYCSDTEINAQKSQSNNCSTSDVKSKCPDSKNDRKNEHPCKPCCKQKQNKPSKSTAGDNDNKSNCTKVNENESSFHMDLTQNFPVVLGLNDMRRITTDSFLEKIKIWKENYIFGCPETRALVGAINNYQFAIKMLISLQEGEEAICYPYGFCSDAGEDSNDLKEIARKGKTAISGRQFQFGSIHNIMGLTYGTLIDFLKIDKWSIKYTYNIHVHKKSPKYDEEKELKHLMTYGCEIMECIKRMSTNVFKFYTNMTGNKQVETADTKPGLDRKSCFLQYSLVYHFILIILCTGCPDFIVIWGYLVHYER